MNTLKLVDIELVKEIRKYDRTLFLVGIAGFIFWRKLRNLELKVEKLEREEKMWDPFKYRVDKEDPKED